LINGTQNRQIKISRDFQPLIFIPQSGNYTIGNSIPGNLNINLIVEKTGTYEVEGKNIKGHLKISPAQAVLGDIIFLDIFGDPVKIVVPPGTKHGETLEKENAGVSKGNKKGSLFLKVTIDIPKKISNEEKNLYTQLLKLQKGYL
jgi:curved DNA-binding protein